MIRRVIRWVGRMDELDWLFCLLAILIAAFVAAADLL